MPASPAPAAPGWRFAARLGDSRAVGGRRAADVRRRPRPLPEATLLELGAAADGVRRRMNPPDRATYQVDRNINYTNVCIYRCTFCAFYRKAGDAEAYVLPGSRRSAGRSRRRSPSAGRASSCRGASTPTCRSPHYEELLGFLRQRLPADSPARLLGPEIYFLAKKERISVAAALKRLKAAGLMSVPGGRGRDPRRRGTAADLGPDEVSDAEVGRGPPGGASPRDADDGHHDVRRRREPGSSG